MALSNDGDVKGLTKVGSGWSAGIAKAKADAEKTAQKALDRAAKRKGTKAPKAKPPKKGTKVTPAISRAPKGSAAAAIRGGAPKTLAERYEAVRGVNDSTRKAYDRWQGAIAKRGENAKVRSDRTKRAEEQLATAIETPVAQGSTAEMTEEQGKKLRAVEVAWQSRQEARAQNAEEGKGDMEAVKKALKDLERSIEESRQLSLAL